MDINKIKRLTKKQRAIYQHFCDYFTIEEHFFFLKKTNLKYNTFAFITISSWLLTGNKRTRFIHFWLLIFCSCHRITSRVCMARLEIYFFDMNEHIFNVHILLQSFVKIGLWVLLDLKLFPEDPTVSAWASLVSIIE